MRAAFQPDENLQLTLRSRALSRALSFLPRHRLPPSPAPRRSRRGLWPTWWRRNPAGVVDDGGGKSNWLGVLPRHRGIPSECRQEQACLLVIHKWLRKETRRTPQPRVHPAKQVALHRARFCDSQSRIFAPHLSPIPRIKRPALASYAPEWAPYDPPSHVAGTNSPSHGPIDRRFTLEVKFQSGPHC
jgi:hypothetical protein